MCDIFRALFHLQERLQDCLEEVREDEKARTKYHASKFE